LSQAGGLIVDTNVGGESVKAFHSDLFDRDTLTQAMRNARAWVIARTALDRVLLSYYGGRIARWVRRAPALPLDPACQGDKLVCIAVRPA
jgi:hypothetical protein